MFLTHDYSIARGVQALGGKQWDEKNTPHFVRKITVGNNCFIGARSVLLPGTTIGDNCIVGAGSIVRGNIPANSIVVGNPATVVAKTTDWAKSILKRRYIKLCQKRR